MSDYSNPENPKRGNGNRGGSRGGSHRGGDGNRGTSGASGSGRGGRKPGQGGQRPPRDFNSVHGASNAPVDDNLGNRIASGHSAGNTNNNRRGKSPQGPQTGNTGASRHTRDTAKAWAQGGAYIAPSELANITSVPGQGRGGPRGGRFGRSQAGNQPNALRLPSDSVGTWAHSSGFGQTGDPGNGNSGNVGNIGNGPRGGRSGRGQPGQRSDAPGSRSGQRSGPRGQPRGQSSGPHGPRLDGVPRNADGFVPHVQPIADGNDDVGNRVGNPPSGARGPRGESNRSRGEGRGSNRQQGRGGPRSGSNNPSFPRVGPEGLATEFNVENGTPHSRRNNFNSRGEPSQNQRPRDGQRSGQPQTGRGRNNQRGQSRGRDYTPSIPGAPERLNKVLSQSGIGSRRSIDNMIAEGMVKVNGEVVSLGVQVTPTDAVTINDRPVRLQFASADTRVLIYHKPMGELVTREDPEGRPTVFRKLPRLRGQRWVAIGRLDFNTEGLLVFTTNGELANRFMHPRYEVDREYAVRVIGDLEDSARDQLLNGVELDGETCRFEAIDDRGGDGLNKWHHVLIKEGKNREVRRLFEAVGLTVSRLIRVRFGSIALPPPLKRGMMRELNETEVKYLMNMHRMDVGSAVLEQASRETRAATLEAEQQFNLANAAFDNAAISATINAETSKNISEANIAEPSESAATESAGLTEQVAELATELVLPASGLINADRSFSPVLDGDEDGVIDMPADGRGERAPRRDNQRGRNAQRGGERNERNGRNDRNVRGRNNERGPRIEQDPSAPPVISFDADGNPIAMASAPVADGPIALTNHRDKQRGRGRDRTDRTDRTPRDGQPRDGQPRQPRDTPRVPGQRPPMADGATRPPRTKKPRGAGGSDGRSAGSEGRSAGGDSDNIGNRIGGKVGKSMFGKPDSFGKKTKRGEKKKTEVVSIAQLFSKGKELVIPPPEAEAPKPKKRDLTQVEAYIAGDGNAGDAPVGTIKLRRKSAPSDIPSTYESQSSTTQSAHTDSANTSIASTDKPSKAKPSVRKPRAPKAAVELSEASEPPSTEAAPKKRAARKTTKAAIVEVGSIGNSAEAPEEKPAKAPRKTAAKSVKKSAKGNVEGDDIGNQ